MREILFRGKDPSGDFVYGSYLNVDVIHKIFVVFTEEEKRLNKGTAIENADGYWEDVLPETVGQFTGLYCNCERVFEGDIVKCRHEWRPNYKGIGEQYEPELAFMEREIKAAYGKHIEDGYCGKRYFYYRNYVVEFHRGYGGWRLRNGNVIHNIGNTTLYNRNAEIIGNIRDNPELLKGGAE